jgi:hypothetical protein
MLPNSVCNITECIHKSVNRRHIMCACVLKCVNAYMHISYFIFHIAYCIFQCNIHRCIYTYNIYIYKYVYIYIGAGAGDYSGMTRSPSLSNSRGVCTPGMGSNFPSIYLHWEEGREGARKGSVGMSE